ncbi:alkaline phosphatase family protein [Microbulbifer magnicolonia]|uniref:alkaline phosphatase family protein n=1 Tax=Microbulbifer magnicolonia TaxID=3109744 RepID=UPI002B412BC7|nr:alkaline phosphatase family protein [Microbulbifer sp. GG15]
MFTKLIPIIAGLVLALLPGGRVSAADNLVLVSIDGLRWQEVFAGYDAALLESGALSAGAESLAEKYGGASAEEKRRRLMPFLWDTVGTRGVLVGNRNRGSKMAVTNSWWFSYPGYNELLSGKADPQIDSNDAVPNPNTTFLEWLNGKRNYRGRIAAFGSWDAFPAIINRERSGVYVNAGFEPADWKNLSQRAQTLNQLLAQIPGAWDTVRYDALTYGLAREYLLQHRPKVLYIALGETDDFAHEKKYGQYLRAAHRADQFIADLWQTLQSIDDYRGNTNLIITVDHGRGRDAATWPHHASPQELQRKYSGQHPLAESGIAGSDEIWLAAIGPDIVAAGEVSGGETLYLNQVAATALLLLGEKPGDFSKDMGAAMAALLNQPARLRRPDPN